MPEAAALAGVGGFLDAYTFLAHGGVFANAQTGNVVLFGVEAAGSHWAAALRHIPPIVAFVVGMVTVEVLARLRHVALLRRTARVVLVIECVVFTVVAFLPASTPTTVFTVIIAWAATLQVGTFRTVRSSSYNTTFTTGNLRSLVSESAAWLADRDPQAGRRARALVAVIVTFAGGAVAGGFAERGLGARAVLLVLPVLLAVLASVALGTERLRRAGDAPTQPG